MNRRLARRALPVIAIANVALAVAGPPAARVVAVVGLLASVIGLWAAHRWGPRLHYRHQDGTCPATARGECPGHSIRADRDGYAHIEALRMTGRLSYLGPHAPHAWLDRLNRR